VHADGWIIGGGVQLQEREIQRMRGPKKSTGRVVHEWRMFWKRKGRTNPLTQRTGRTQNALPPGFSLVELVIVIVIIGVIAAIAVPRVSRGAEGASRTKFVSDLNTLRRAVELYSAEHDGRRPTTAGFANQLTKFTDGSGNVSSTRDFTFKYGPYINTIPNLGIGSEKNVARVGPTAVAGVGWVYTQTSGNISGNTGAATDRRGILLSTY